MAKDKLERNVSCFNAWAMIVGTIIGTGIFFKPQAVFDATGSASFGLMAWVIGCFMGLWKTLFAGRGKAALWLFHVL